MQQICYIMFFFFISVSCKVHAPKAVKKVSVPEGACTQTGQYLADDYDCTVYYECDDNLVPVEFHCDPGLCWYQAVRECIWADEYPSLCTTACL